jgi:hypothetical protein
MSLPSKPRNVLRGRISFIGVNARKENLITALSALWHSSGFVSFSPVGKPTSLTMNPSILTPSQKGIPPLLPLDGPPQRLEGTRRRWGVGCLCRIRVLLTAGAPWQPEGAPGPRHFERRALREPWFPVQEGRLRRFGLSRGNSGPGFAGWGFLLESELSPVSVD